MGAIGTKGSFAIENEEWKNGRDHVAEFSYLVEKVNAVDHGEFGEAVKRVLKVAEKGEDVVRPPALAVQRCRRGGKTFMLHAVASKVSQQVTADTHVIFITMNSQSRYLQGEDAYQAILGRIAYEYTECIHSYYSFRDDFTDFRSVGDWIHLNKVILIVDELNAIPITAPNYDRMSSFLDSLVGRKGSALIYSTHHRETGNLLRGRLAGADALLSVRDHDWLMIPRIVEERCLRGLLRDSNSQPSFWCAVLRGRLPSLFLQDDSTIRNYGRGLFPNASVEERVASLAAVITGDIENLPNTRNHFGAFSYMSERFQNDDGARRFAWPPFLVSQFHVLGKNCGSLRTSLEDPSIDEAKAFEALTQLAVLTRLLSAEHHDLVPYNDDIPEGGSIEATEIFHVAESATDIDGVTRAVQVEFARRPKVLQVVAVPYHASFPTYDFFVLHRSGNNHASWVIKAGYQCKKGHEQPCVDASQDVDLSVWIEAECRKYRVRQDGAHVQRRVHRGWVLLGESSQTDMLGVTVSEALPAEEADDSYTEHGKNCCSTTYHICPAALDWEEKQQDAEEEQHEAEQSSSTEASDESEKEGPEAKKARIDQL